MTMDAEKISIPFQENKVSPVEEIMDTLEAFPEEVALYFGKASLPYSDSDELLIASRSTFVTPDENKSQRG